MVANITHGAADIFHGAGVILLGMASILSNVLDILLFQHQFFEIFLSVLGFFPTVLKNLSSCKKTDYHFLGGWGLEPKVTLFFLFF